MEQLRDALDEREREIEGLNESLHKISEGKADAPPKVNQQLPGSNAKTDRVKYALVPLQMI